MNSSASLRPSPALALMALLCLILMGGTAHSQQPDRPLIFLPGILGSKLYKGNDLVWGDRSSYSNFRKLQLPFNGTDDIQARGVVEQVRVLGPFRTKQYSELFEYLTDELKYVRGQTLFIFAYDWRKSNFTSAKQLQLFIDETPALQVGSIDILAHSMGGIVARIFIDKHPGGARVSRFVSLGAPFLGSLDILEAFVNGFDGLKRLLAGSDELVRTVLFSFQSGFELLPMYPNCCYIGPDWDSRQKLDITDPAVWEQLWFPPSFKNDQGRAHVRNAMQRRRQIDLIVNKQLDWNKTYHAALATSIISTKGKVRFENDGSVGEWRDDFQGDGRVTLPSATNNTPFHSRVSLSKHGRIFDDKAARDNMQRIFITYDDLFNFGGETRQCENSSHKDCVEIGDYEISGADLSASPGIAFVGEPVVMKLTLIVDKAGQDFPFEPKVCVQRPNDSAIPSTCHAMGPAIASDARFQYEFVHAPDQEGTYSISINEDSGLGFAPDDYFMTFKDDNGN